MFGEDFDHQVERLVSSGYPESCRMSPAAFRGLLTPLKEQLSQVQPAADDLRIPFVIVISGSLLPADRAMPLIRLGDRTGFTRMAAEDLEAFAPAAGVVIPAGPAYLLLDVDTGGSTLNMPPDQAMTVLAGQNRLPLTIDEGIALLGHAPDILRSRNCFSLLGSRCGDRRVPALWMSAGRPRLGWCWAGAPHSWLGSASCSGRLGVASRESVHREAF